MIAIANRLSSMHVSLAMRAAINLAATITDRLVYPRVNSTPIAYCIAKMINFII